MNYKIIFPGFPGKMTTGTLGWGAMIYLEHAGHKIMFDTAGPAKRAQVLQRVKATGVEPEEIDTLVISHFHYDHVYNYDYFPNARILLHKVEADWVESNPGNYAIPPNYYEAIKKTGRLMLIDKDEEIFPGISTLLVPGHTPGGMALILQDNDMPVTILAGDAVKNIAELATGKVPKAWSINESAKSIKKIRDIAEVVIPGHDRILQVTDKEIRSITKIHETIVLPPGVLKVNEPTNFELIIEPTTLPKQSIV